MIKFNKIEKRVLSFWKKNSIFKRSLLKKKGSPNFVFFEGPPTANGLPGIHHILSRAFKDIILRYKTMRGFYVLRRAGWDTHGLPVEIEIEKKLGINNKKEIENYGIGRFNKKCKESTDFYRKRWEKFTQRVGFWLDLENPYITYHSDYIESVWQIIKKLFERELLYEDYRVSPYCPRCETPLSSHELSQGYKRIKEKSIYVKFPIVPSKKIPQKNSFFLAWTTTPWTLPSNVALAVNPKFSYVQIKTGKEYLILLKEKVKELDIKGTIKREFLGKELEGLFYKPLFQFEKVSQKAFYVVSGDFVSKEEGTGIVHIAPAFGEDDFKIGKKYKLPTLVLVDERGRFKNNTGELKGLFFKEADSLIIEKLKKKNFLFKEEIYEHDYPFCWRCKTPLMYYLRKTWFIKVSKVKKDLLKNAEKINWIPSYLKKGRFGEWLREVKDWALSRERYWGTPLPIWKCPKCGYVEVIGSLDELRKKVVPGNTYFLLRHGESVKNVRRVEVCWPEKIPSPLTEKGRRQIKKAALSLRNEKIDLIVSSDLLRTKETAEIVAKELGVKVLFDKRLREINFGIFNGKNAKEMNKYFNPEGKLSQREVLLEKFEKRWPKGENYLDVQKRLYSLLLSLEKKYKGKRILLVSHCRPITFLEGLMKGWQREKIINYILKKKEISKGEIRKIVFKKFPYNEKFEIDLHRPYIDEVEIKCPKCAFSAKRVNDVIDVWFDSGSMPFAQWHYPFENKKLIDQKIQFPADYISEAIDQTRGWFYTLLAISTLLGKGTPYKNVVSLGHVVDEKGEKMSKSKGNIVEPWGEIEKFGVDAIRWYFFIVNEPGEVKRYDRRELFHRWQKTGFTLLNCWNFFKIYIPKGKFDPYLIYHKINSKNVLDKWAVSLFSKKVNEIGNYLDQFFITKAARSIEEFLEDFSDWYLRRSRRRFQISPSKEEKEIFFSLLFNLNLILAPFIPFLTEHIFQEMKGYSKRKIPESVHLLDWPKIEKKNITPTIERKMEKVREIIREALSLRSSARIKVRQPLLKLEIPPLFSKNDREFLDLIKEEVNVKKVVIGKKILLDTEITPALKEEGERREIIRQIQELRKRMNLTPQDIIEIFYETDSGHILEILKRNEKEILRLNRAISLTPSLKKVKKRACKELNLSGEVVKIGIRKVKRKI